MGLEGYPPSPDELLAAVHAEQKLAEMDLHEDLAVDYEQARYAVMQQAFAESYHDLIGVYPEQRMEFRSVLEKISKKGGPSIANVIASFNSRFR